jgi:hypothetical protein
LRIAHETMCPSSTYNLLPDIMDADAAIEPLRSTLDEIIGRGSELCNSTPFGHGETGTFLLHKHWDVEHEQRMVERPGSHPMGRPALITAAERVTDSPRAAPTRFSVDSRRRALVPLEFSTDQYAVQVWQALLAHPTYLDDVFALISDSGLASQVGVAILARATVTPAVGEEMVEENWNEMSVVSARTLPDDPDSRVVQTAWAFASPERFDPTASSCIGYCMTAGSGPHCVHHYNRPAEVIEVVE